MNFVLLFGLTASSFMVVHGDEKMLGPGKWSVLNINKCEEDDSMVLKFEANRRKINRTHDGFNAKMCLDEIIDDSYAINVEICKMVDGGCKPYQQLSDPSFKHFVKKYAKNNVKDILANANIDPPDFPVPKGDHELKSYAFNYNELPPECPYGEYGCTAYLLKDGLKRGCVFIHIRCQEKEEDCEDED